MVAGPWGGHANGRIPRDALEPVPHVLYYGARSSAMILRRDMALAVGRIAARALATPGNWGPNVTDCYRDYPTQVRLRDQWCNRGQCQMAAFPGTSIHGWALAIDAGFSDPKGLARFFHAHSTFCMENGIFWPAWARRVNTYEPWHWEYNANLDQHRNSSVPHIDPVPENEMNPIKFNERSERVIRLQRVINGINGRTRELGWPYTPPALVLDGHFGGRTVEALASAYGRAVEWGTINFHTTDMTEVDEHLVALLVTFCYDLGKATGRNAIPG